MWRIHKLDILSDTEEWEAAVAHKEHLGGAFEGLTKAIDSF
jgi:hypothetical protein